MRDVTELFSGDTYSFQNRPDNPIPDSCAGVYTIWESDRFIYVGIAGRDLQKVSKSKVRGLKQRLRTHWNGGLGGDQFAVYVFERITAPQLTQEQLKAMGEGSLTLIELNREYIHTKLSYRFLVTDTYSEAMEIERMLKSGQLDSLPKPFLNPT
jgi:hypothetical protein